jgi:hypothetical protein
MRPITPAFIISGALLSLLAQHAEATPIAPNGANATVAQSTARDTEPGQAITISCGNATCTRVWHAYPYSHSHSGYYSPYDVPYYGYYRPWGWSDLNRSWWHWPW